MLLLVLLHDYPAYGYHYLEMTCDILLAKVDLVLTIVVDASATIVVDASATTADSKIA